MTETNRIEYKRELTLGLEKEAIALREAVVNVIVHNDYSNEVPQKFEIFSNCKAQGA